ncbi:MAG TPA: polysaccharide biosynthesis/export family protein [Acidobacteriaceae bacterium]|nr:polysaccharide biosynthesis/export family protein [Acidobacteriaceae bacterium]
MKHSFSKIRWILPCLILAAGAVLLHAQQTPPAGGDTPASPAQKTPELKISPLKALKSFEPEANAEYEIGPGDVVSLDFPGRPELSGKKKVGPDGRITLNLAGAVKVADMTRSQAAKAIADSLAPYYTDLTVTVDLDSYGSNRVIVLGNVQHPGVLYFDDTPTLLDVIARGGLMANSGSAIPGSTARDGIPDRCAIYRGNDQVVWVDLKSLLQSGNSLADLRLKRNDIVFVPSQQEIFVSVLGAVQHPGAVPLTGQSTLTSVLAQSGGMAEGASSKIQVIQQSTGKTITIAYKDLLSPKGADEVQLHSGDVIFVPQSGLYKSTYVLQRLSPIATIGSIAAFATVP